MSITFRWYRFTLPNGRKVYLSNRPDSVDDNSVQEFIGNEKPGIRFMFTDDLVEPPPNGPAWHWFPWVPLKNPPLENLFAFICQFQRFNDSTPVEVPAWLHCDSSTMRAPTYFGVAIHALYPNDLESISSTLLVKEGAYQHPSDPVKYAEIEFRLNTKTKDMVDYWVKGGMKAAHKYYMDQEFLI